MRWSGFRLRACAEALTAFTILLIAPDTAPAQAATAELPRDLSPWGMYLTADSLVKGVLIALVLASVITWTVWLAKSIELIAAKRRARNALTALAAVRDMSDASAQLGRNTSPAGRFVQAAVAELRLSDETMAREGIKERIASRLERIEANGGRHMMRGTGVLATIGAIAPFVGLFGTVWGIMNSFFQIGQEQNSSLAVVAPGISEALFATAVGLFAAIPAVIAYNRFSHRVNMYEARLRRFADKVHAHIGRELERG